MRNGTPKSVAGIHAITRMTRLNRSKNLGLDKVTTLDDLGTSVGLIISPDILLAGLLSTHVSGLAVGLEQFRHVKLWRLQDLGFSNVNVVKGVDALSPSTPCRLSSKRLSLTLQAFSISRPIDSGTNF